MFILITNCAFAEANPVIWKATYYNAIPNNPNVSQQYCDSHEPGTFIGNVNDQLKNGAITNRGIKLTNFTFHQELHQGIFFMNGTLLASGIDDKQNWQTKISYYVYKLSPNGITNGVWSSKECKGLYKGEVIKI
jgi:hypothetical protein